MKAERENESEKREIGMSVRMPLYQDQIRKFKDRICLGDIFWFPSDDGGVEIYSVMEKNEHFVRLQKVRRRRTVTILQLMKEQLEAQNRRLSEKNAEEDPDRPEGGKG